MKKGTIAKILSFLLIAMLAVGCTVQAPPANTGSNSGTNTNTGTGTGTATKEPTKAPAQQGPEMIGNMYKEGTPIVKDPVNYYFNDLSPEEYEEMIEIASKTGQSFD